VEVSYRVISKKVYRNFLHGKVTEDEVKKQFHIVESEYNKRMSSLSNRSLRTKNFSFGLDSSLPPSLSRTTSISHENLFDNNLYMECFNSNPFFRFRRCLLNRFFEKALIANFHITEEDLHTRGNVIQLFSLEPIPGTNEKNARTEQVFRHFWPIGPFAVCVNRRTIPIRRATKKDPDRVAELTSFCHIGNNDLQVFSGANSSSSRIFLNVMNSISVEVLVECVRSSHVRDFDTALAEVRQSFERAQNPEEKDMEIQEISSKISLICPLSLCRLRLPARSIRCGHLKCFDLESFLQLNERIPRWNLSNLF